MECEEGYEIKEQNFILKWKTIWKEIDSKMPYKEITAYELRSVVSRSSKAGNIGEDMILSYYSIPRKKLSIYTKSTSAEELEMEVGEEVEMFYGTFIHGSKMARYKVIEQTAPIQLKKKYKVKIKEA